MTKKLPKLVREIQQNPPKAINYAFEKNISHSQMTIYNSCNLRWKLQYKDKLKPFTSSIHTVFGSAIHEAIQKYLDVFYNQSKAAADRLELVEIFNEYYIKFYKEEYSKNNDTHFSTAEEMREFYNDGEEILIAFKKKISKYFSKRGWYLVGCEIPITITPIVTYSNIYYLGYLDVVLYHEPTNTIKIIDLKTSTRGWRDKDKKNQDKLNQIILYKKYFSEQYQFPIDNIEVEFVILKRKLWENCDFTQSRIQSFIPASGKIKVKKAAVIVEEFIKDAFNTDGSIKEKEYIANPSKWNCGFCPFKDNPILCQGGVNFK